VVVKPRRFTIWQCRDWCCSSKPYSFRWWNVGIAPGNYHSVPNLTEACHVVRLGRLPWSVELDPPEFLPRP
jgi:hypothetical protein